MATKRGHLYRAENPSEIEMMKAAEPEHPVMVNNRLVLMRGRIIHCSATGVNPKVRGSWTGLDY